MTRQNVMALSIGVSLVAHAFLVGVSPRVAVLSKARDAAEVVRYYRINLSEQTLAPEPPPDFSAPARMLASRPGSIEDMLRPSRGEGEDSLESLLSKPVDVPGLAGRVAAEHMDRAYTVEQEPVTLEHIDGKIIEISQETARRDVQIARRLVAPSSDRVVEANECPTLRQPLDPGEEEILAFDPLAPGALAGGGAPGSGAGLGPLSAESPGVPAGGLAGLMPEEAPPDEPGALEPLVAKDDSMRLPELPIEAQEARAPIAKQIQNDRPYEFLDDTVSIQMDAYLPPGESEGFFRLRIVPKENKKTEPLPKDVTFVVDASNSITQRKLDITLAGLRKTVADLRPEDTFNIVLFRDAPSQFQPQRVPATPENKAAAEAFLKGQEARGETDVYQALHLVTQEPSRPGIPNIILVASDGRPTTGIKDARTIINTFTAENEKGKSVFAYGGGKTVNRYLLELLAYRNKGESHVTGEIDAIRDDLPKFASALTEPILARCEADFGLIDSANVFPKQLPDFFRGRAVTVYGKFDPKESQDFALRLTGQAASHPKEVIFRADLDKAASGDKEIARMWALWKVYSIIDEMCSVGEKPELLAELRELSRKYGIKTSYDF